MVQKLVLDNGTTVLIDRMQDVRSFALGFFVGAGSSDEPPDRQGISHFLEHVLFDVQDQPAPPVFEIDDRKAVAARVDQGELSFEPGMPAAAERDHPDVRVVPGGGLELRPQ